MMRIPLTPWSFDVLLKKMACLIDINALLALAWPNHPHHHTAIRWLEKLGSDQSWATCATTQLGFIRISSQPKFSPHHVSPGVACEILSQWIVRPGHVYWQEESGGLSGLAFQRVLPAILTHNFVTDGFLASVAAVHGGKLATFDRSLARLFGDSVEIIQ